MTHTTSATPHLSARPTRSVRRASGLVLVAKPEVIQCRPPRLNQYPQEVMKRTGKSVCAIQNNS